MTNDKRFILTFALACWAVITPAVAAAPSVLGEWRVEDGSAHIRTLMCGKTLWGAISWEKTPGTDEYDPDVAKRSLPTLGLPILLNMTPDEGDAKRWKGRIYNAESGKFYDGSITLTASGTLHVEGCLIAGVMCGGEDWTREKPTKAISNAAICKRALGK